MGVSCSSKILNKEQNTLSSNRPLPKQKQKHKQELDAYERAYLEALSSLKAVGARKETAIRLIAAKNIDLLINLCAAILPMLPIVLVRMMLHYLQDLVPIEIGARINIYCHLFRLWYEGSITKIQENELPLKVCVRFDDWSERFNVYVDPSDRKFVAPIGTYAVGLRHHWACPNCRRRVHPLHSACHSCKIQRSLERARIAQPNKTC